MIARTRTRTRRPVPARDDGFSLVELIVAIAIVSLVGLLLADAVTRNRLVLGIVTEAADAEPAATLHQALRRLLSEIAPRADQPGPTPGAVTGTIDTMRFTSRYTPAGGTSGLTEYVLAFRKGPSSTRGALVLDYRLASARTQETWASMTLLDAVSSVSFGYVGEETAEVRTQWRGPRPPRLIEIEIQCPGCPATAHPKLRVAPKIAF